MLENSSIAEFGVKLDGSVDAAGSGSIVSGECVCGFAMLRRIMMIKICRPFCQIVNSRTVYTKTYYSTPHA